MHRHYAFFYPQNDPLQEVEKNIIIPIFRRRIWASDDWNNFLKVTQLVFIKAMTLIEYFWGLLQCSLLFIAEHKGIFYEWKSICNNNPIKYFS